MRCACIDVGSNTTRLLVADVDGDRLRELMSQRVFTRIGKGLRRTGRISAEKIDEVVEVVATQERFAAELEVDEAALVGTAAIRTAENGDELVRALAEQCGLPMTVLSEEEEGRLSFVGATRTLAHDVDGEVVVLDVGGGSTEVVAGTLADGAHWAHSYPLGSGSLVDTHINSDPPGAAELDALHAEATAAFAGLDLPPPALAVAVGGSAGSLRRLAGRELDHETLGRAFRILASTSVDELVRRFELDPERARLLPGGIAILDELSVRLDSRLLVGTGGLREGVLLELAEGIRPGERAPRR